MRRSKKILIAVGVLALLIGAGLFAFSPAGLRLFTPLLERQLSRAWKVPVELEGLVLRWPLQLDLAALRAADADAVYLDVRDVSLRVSARQLARRHIWLHVLRAEHIAYNGFPPRETDERPAREPEPVVVPDPGWWVERVTLAELHVSHVALGDGVVPKSITGRVEGRFMPVPDGKEWALVAHVLSWDGEEMLSPQPALHMDGALLESARNHWRMTVAAEARNWAPLVPDWPDEVADNIQLRVACTMEDGREVRLEEATVRTPLAHIDGTGEWDVKANQLLARLEATVPDAALLSGWLGTDMEGAVSASIQLEGDALSPALSVQVQTAYFRAGTHEASDIRASLEADSLAVISRGSVSVEAMVNRLPVAVSASYRLESSRVSLQDMQASVLNARMTGDVRFDWHASALHGLIHVETDTIAELAAHWDVEAQGRVEAVLRMAMENGRQEILLEALAAEVVLPYGAMDALYVEASVQDVFHEPTGTMRVRLHDVAAGDVDVHVVQMIATGDLQAVEFELNGSGEFLEPWHLAATGALSMEDLRPEELVLHAFSFEHREFVLALDEAVRMRRADDRYAVEGLALRIGEGRLLASGQVYADAVEFEADLEDLPLSTFGFAGVGEASGEMEGRLRVSGHPSDPHADLQLVFSGLMPANTNFWDAPPAQFSVFAQLEDRRLKSRFLLEGLTGRPVELELNVPLHVSLYPVHMQWPPEGDVSGRLLAETDLGELATLFVLDVHRLAGTLSVDLSLSGTVDEPDVSGEVRVEDGAYEHGRTGTLLRNLDMAVSGRRDRLSIDRLSASDGDKGRVELSGHLLIKPEDGYPFSGSLTLDRFRLLRHDTAQATGHGTVTWEGNRHASVVAGRLSVAPMELRIPERVPAALIDLEVIEINGDEEPEEALADELEDKWAAHALSLDVELAFPERAFVRGRGLDSEWSGQVRIQGRAQEPEISGSFSVLRGRFVFFGKRLGITRGVVTLDGSLPPRPTIDAVAETRSGGITAILRLVGDVQAPEIQLDSVPEMPEDEILARLLFGREAARITPWQAITLAQAVNRLRGASTFDLMGHTRRILRVDQIEVRDDEEHEGQAAVSVGKYVSDRVYVELERGVGVEGGRAKVEVEVTPTIRVETEMGTDADAGLDVIWSWDY